MPFTPYHFGPSGFIGLLFRRWIDPVVFVAANIIIDVEVLFAPGWPHHRHWHWHSFLIGGIVGAIFGASLYLIKPVRRLIAWGMKLVRIRYKPGLIPMTVAGALGACFHVLVDGLYHYDVQPLFPKKTNPLWQWINESWANDEATKHDIKIACLLFFIPVIILYIQAVRNFNKQDKSKDVPAK